MSIGERIRKARKEHGLSQARLAELIGTSQQALASIEKGDTRNTSYLLPIARCLNVSPFYLETGDTENKVKASILLSDDELSLLSSFRCLSSENKAILLKLLNALQQ